MNYFSFIWLIELLWKWLFYILIKNFKLGTLNVKYDCCKTLCELQHTVYRENFALVLFLPFSLSELRANSKLGLLNSVQMIK